MRQSNRNKDASQATGEGVALSWATAVQRQRLQLDRESPQGCHSEGKSQFGELTA